MKFSTEDKNDVAARRGLIPAPLESPSVVIDRHLAILTFVFVGWIIVCDMPVSDMLEACAAIRSDSVVVQSEALTPAHGSTVEYLSWLGFAGSCGSGLKWDVSAGSFAP